MIANLMKIIKCEYDCRVYIVIIYILLFKYKSIKIRIRKKVFIENIRNYIWGVTYEFGLVAEWEGSRLNLHILDTLFQYFKRNIKIATICL